MAILQSVTYGGQTFEVPDKLSELSDVNVPANAANGSILTLQNGKWVPLESVTGAKLTGLNTSQGGAVTESDTVLSAFGKLQYESIRKTKSSGFAQSSISPLYVNNNITGLQVRATTIEGVEFIVTFSTDGHIYIATRDTNGLITTNAKFTKDA